jgi:hypothetical protein
LLLALAEQKVPQDAQVLLRELAAVHHLQQLL